MKIKKLNPAALTPTYGSAGAAAFDLHSVESVLLRPGCSAAVRTGLAFEIPKGHVMLVYSRSGMGMLGVRLSNCVGVIDSDYRGEVRAHLTNDSDMTKVFPEGSRIAQAMVLPVKQTTFIETDALSSTERGEGGFGSTGK